MFESTSLIVYTLFCIVASVCFVSRTIEFVANGLTVENLLRTVIIKEYDNFVLHHIQRTSFSIIVYSSLPLVYLLGTLFVNNSEKSFVYVYFDVLCLLFLVPIGISVSVVYNWKSNDWANHPLRIVLNHYDPADWTIPAHNITTEFRSIEKLTLTCGTLKKTVVTQNWIISIDQFNVSVAKKSESLFTVYSSDIFDNVPDGTPGAVQFINIEVTALRSRIKPFSVRIRSEDFQTLEEHIGHPIQISDNVKLQRSRTERFLEVFREQVSQNPVYRGYTAAELEDNTCAGCLVNIPNVKLTKCCDDDPVNEMLPCSSCQCRPMWCVDCMAKWYESRQPQNDTTIWLSSKCTCPLCRQVFCILDVCPLENFDFRNTV
ncbi:Putative transmembrane protein precursor [Cinara cedri]|uniref:Transmembrane protein n=1 Tax=Cinara cedri TaxID=506608 RepID=A0A5E4NM18_9HEMI|nr:Putative transmembrane protein precursor [Cinara cedri]